MFGSHDRIGAPKRPATGARSRERHSPEVRRAEILDGALALFSERGYARATLNDVAERIGVTKGCVYHHFSSKEELLVELLRDRTLGAVQAAKERRDASGAEPELAEQIESIWQHYEQPGQTEVAMLAMSELAKIPEGGKFLFDEVLVKSRAPLRRALQDTGSGGVSSPAESERAAIVIPLMVMGVAIGMRLFRTLDPITYSAAEVRQLGKTVSALLQRGAGGEAA
ncbi:MAG: TetR/AcrR family transcriptional regulator [Gemmatimonadaceae bacterium]